MIKKKIKKTSNPREKLRRARDLFERNKNKSQLSGKKSVQMSHLLAAGVAHEFNNILGAVDGHAEWALSLGQLKEATEALEAIRLACARSAQVTRSLQYFAQPVEENFRFFDFSESVEMLREELKPWLLRLNIDFQNQLPKKLQIWGDPRRIEEILRNLFKNSIEAFSDLNRDKTIGILCVKKVSKESQKVFEIYDNGPGISEVFREMLFQPFFTTKGVLKTLQGQEDRQQLPKDSPKSEVFSGGSGLGLYRSKTIALEHGGSLDLKSTIPGQGTTWRLRLKEKPE